MLAAEGYEEGAFFFWRGRLNENEFSTWEESLSFYLRKLLRDETTIIVSADQYGDVRLFGGKLQNKLREWIEEENPILVGRTI